MIELRIGERGCGKSDMARQLMGMTHEEIEKYNEDLQTLLKIEREYKEQWGLL